MKLEVDELRNLLDLANKMRRFKGDGLLEDLPDSKPQVSNACLVASAFNYGCKVLPNMKEIIFQTEEDKKTYISIVGEEYSEVDSSMRLGHHTLSAKLPDWVAALARDFDLGNYSEYDINRPAAS